MPHKIIHIHEKSKVILINIFKSSFMKSFIGIMIKCMWNVYEWRMHHNEIIYNHNAHFIKTNDNEIQSESRF